jgi:hypothetical protein
MNVHPHGVNRTVSGHHAGLAVYHPLEVACPFTEVSVVVAVLLAAVLLDPAALVACVAELGLSVVLAPLAAAGVADPVGIAGAGWPATFVVSPTSTVSSDVAARSW